MKLTLAQINTVVGDLRGNSNKVLHYSEKAHARGADLIVFPELTLTGYPPIDLLESRDFSRTRTGSVRKITRLIRHISRVGNKHGQNLRSHKNQPVVYITSDRKKLGYSAGTGIPNPVEVGQ